MRIRSFTAGLVYVLASTGTAGAGVCIDNGKTGNRSAARFIHPSENPIKSGFGMRLHPVTHFMRFHAGIDYDGNVGDAVYASGDGLVISASNVGDYGLLIVILHPDARIVTSYAHLNDTVVRSGDCVRRGQIIGHIGRSGLVSGAHLHLEIYQNIDPGTLLPAR